MYNTDTQEQTEGEALTQSKVRILHCLLASLSSLEMLFQGDSMDCRTSNLRRILAPASCSGDALNANSLREEKCDVYIYSSSFFSFDCAGTNILRNANESLDLCFF